MMETANWEYRNTRLLEKAGNQVDNSLQNRIDAGDNSQAAERSLVNTIDDVQQRFIARMTDIQDWRHLLEEEVGNLDTEIQALTQWKVYLGKQLEWSATPSAITNQCLQLRECRERHDLVQDAVEVTLHREMQTIQESQWNLQAKFDECVEELRALRSVKHMLVADHLDKVTALGIEDDCLNMQAPRFLTQPDPDQVNRDRAVDPATWQQFSDTNIKKSVEERARSESLRRGIKALLDSTVAALAEASQHVRMAFQQRLVEVKSAGELLVSQIAHEESEIERLEQSMSHLEQAIEEKNAPLQIAKDRLRERTKRPNVELVKDAVDAALRTQIAEIEASIKQLKESYASSYDHLKALRRAHLKMEQDLAIKNNSVQIDQHCMQLRKQLPSNPFTEVDAGCV